MGRGAAVPEKGDGGFLQKARNSSNLEAIMQKDMKIEWNSTQFDQL